MCIRDSIGSVSTKGLNHLIYEIVDNSVDEFLAGYCDEITVSLNKDGTATITDNGRGIPVGINERTGKTAVEMVFTMLHAGGKFGDGGYKLSLIHISEPTRRTPISYAVFCLKKKKK